MPPTKYGANLAKTSTATVSSTTQKKLDFKVVKHAKAKTGKAGIKKPQLGAARNKDEGLLKLRIPLNICKKLPSHKKFIKPGKNKMKDILIKEDLDMEEKKPTPQTLLGVKRKRGEQQKYHLKLVAEDKFSAMVWDIAFSKSGKVIITTSNGAFISDVMMENMEKLENIILGGGITLLSDGKIVILCRFMDAINVFTADGSFLKSFAAGFSPQCLLANEKDEILVSDTGKKEIRIYNTTGKLLRTIERTGEGYQFRWPMYMTRTTKDEIIISDCHSQKLFVFDKEDKFVNEFPLKTFGGNQVLKPHGLCSSDDDIFIIDCAIDSMEVFLADGTFLQTLLPSEEGVNMKPKICRTSPDGQYLVIGGLTGHIRVYKFVSEPAIKQELEVTLQVKTEPIVKPVKPPKIKREPSFKMKQETTPTKKRKNDEDVIVLD